MAAQLKTVQMDVDAKHLIQGLRNAFTTKLNTVAEMLQNARRAGATVVHITWASDIFTIEDDGEGISDFQKLIRIGGSDWSEAVKNAEGPYGLGVLSAFFSAEHIRIESGEFILDTDTDTILRQEDILLQAATEPRAGAKITLTGHQLGELQRSRLERLVRGFPIPVIVNGTELPAQNRMDRCFVDIDVGHFRFDEGDQAQRPPALYLQGLPLSQQELRSSHGSSVLHLDPVQFAGRFPDRDVLLNAQEAERNISRAVAVAVRSLLVRKKAEMTPEDFVLRFGEHCLGWRCAELLNDVEWLPVAWFYEIADEPLRVCTSWDGLGACTPKGDAPAVQSRAALEAGFISSEGFTDEGVGFLPAAFAQRKGLSCLNRDKLGRLHRDHWVHSFEIISRELTVTITGHVGTAYLDIGSAATELSACQAFEISHAVLGAVRIENECVFTGNRPESDEDDERIGHWNVVLAPTCDADAVKQLDSFEYEDDFEKSYEARVSDAAHEFMLAYHRATGVGPAARLEEVLRHYVGWNIPAELGGKTFQVTLREHGVIDQVTEVG